MKNQLPHQATVQADAAEDLPVKLDFTQDNGSSAEYLSSQSCTPRSFAALQLRARSAVRALLGGNGRNLLLLCGSSSFDQLQTACDLLQEVGGSEATVAFAPTRFELFGNEDTPGVLTSPGCVVMPCAHLVYHPKWLGMVGACLSQNRELKLILCGDAADCADLRMLFPELDNALHADVITEFPADEQGELPAALLSYYAVKFGFKHFDARAVRLLCTLCTRLSGDRRYYSLPELRLRALAQAASAYSTGPVVEARHLLKAMAAEDFRVNFLQCAELRDHRDHQILIETRGAVVGQINGLSVVETAGTSYEYGEPVRITATLRAGGEGDVIDIERKAELAGQIHAKAMMIINGFLTKEFGSAQPLPVSASLVFEQSYSEIDGDSASLTGLCAVLSCLAALPLRQDLAVTGAVDQFGDVQPVGGVNEKIEGFFRICRLHGLTGTQGVIIPLSCVHQLVLRESVMRALREGRFHIYAVSHVRQAMQLLCSTSWGTPEEEGTVSGLICAHLEEIVSRGGNKPWWHLW
ncbi:MAG: hypothetical protein IJ228_01340 [Succinivibrio sp.]|nr:hypothetical protein [Succinivibrio sp.]